MIKDFIGYFLVAAGVTGISVGTRFVCGGDAIGWIGIAGGFPLAIVAYFLVRPPPPTRAREAVKGETPPA
jgi:hypothetical protein